MEVEISVLIHQKSTSHAHSTLTKIDFRYVFHSYESQLLVLVFQIQTFLTFEIRCFVNFFKYYNHHTLWIQIMDKHGKV